MLTLDIFVNGEGMLKDYAGKIIEAKDTIKIGALDKGTTSGKASVSIGIPLPDGRLVFAQTSLKLFLQAAAIFASAYPEGHQMLDGEYRKNES